jgi:hypothetical protein
MRRSRLLWAVGALAVLLTVQLARELAPQDAVVEKSPARAAATVAAKATLTAATPDRSDQWAGELTSRPPFNPSRRGDAARAGGLGAAAELPRLAGLVVSDGIKRAIFQPVGQHPPIIADEGGTVEGWTIEAITADSVTLSGPGGTRTLHPKFDMEGGTAGPPSGGPLVPPVSQSPVPAPSTGLFQTQKKSSATDGLGIANLVARR